MQACQENLIGTADTVCPDDEIEKKDIKINHDERGTQWRK